MINSCRQEAVRAHILYELPTIIADYADTVLYILKKSKKFICKLNLAGSNSNSRLIK